MPVTTVNVAGTILDSGGSPVSRGTLVARLNEPGYVLDGANKMALLPVPYRFPIASDGSVDFQMIPVANIVLHSGNNARWHVSYAVQETKADEIWVLGTTPDPVAPASIPKE